MKQSLRAMLHFFESNILVPDRQILWVPFAVWVGKKIIERDHIQAILVTCPPHSGSIIGALLSRITRTPLYLDFRDEWISAHDFGRRPRILQIAERWLEVRTIGHARKVTAATEGICTNLRVRYPAWADRIVWLPNGYDSTELPRPIDDASSNAEPSTDDPFTIIYGGALNRRRNVDGLVDAVARIRHLHPEIAGRMQVLFHGEYWDSTREKLQAPGVAGLIQVRDGLPHREFLRVCGQAHVSLAIVDDDYPSAVPAKIYESWALGKPVLLLADGGEARDLVTSNNLGLVAAPDRPREIEARILELFRAFEAGTLPRPSQRGLERFDRKRLARQLAQLMDTAPLASD